MLIEFYLPYLVIWQVIFQQYYFLISDKQTCANYYVYVVRCLV